MTKFDLIEELATRADIPKKMAEKVINMMFKSMSDTLARGDRIDIRGFGTFVSKHYPAYNGRNPRTGEVVHVAEKRSPFFKVGRELRKRVDNKPSSE